MSSFTFLHCAACRALGVRRGSLPTVPESFQAFFYFPSKVKGLEYFSFPFPSLVGFCQLLQHCKDLMFRLLLLNVLKLILWIIYFDLGNLLPFSL